MAISLTVLASGSRGNAAAVVSGERRILVDLGLSPRMLRRRLAAAGAHELESTTDAVLTHFDHDHLNAGWIGELRARPWTPPMLKQKKTRQAWLSRAAIRHFCSSF